MIEAEQPQKDKIPLVVCGPSGVGKGTLLDMLEKYRPNAFAKSVSHTTRKPRAGEENGVHYHFVDREVMLKGIQNGEFVEHCEIHGNLYGTSVKEFTRVKDSVSILEIDFNGANAIRAMAVDAHFLFILPESVEQLESRLRFRGSETEETLNRRLETARREMLFFQNCQFEHKVIVNNEKTASFARLLRWLEEKYPHICEAGFAAIPTTPFTDQKPGTSGLRKKTGRFMEAHYLENFIQSTLDVVGTVRGQTLVVSGDGRYFNTDATATILRICAANGVGKVIVAKNLHMSTPCVSHVIRARKALGGFLLTASHNPGGPANDFGIKYNCDNGGPAPEAFTDAVYERTKTISEYHIALAFPVLDFDHAGVVEFEGMQIELVDAAEEYSLAMQAIFDFPALKQFVNRADFTMVFDSMSGVAGPFARRIFGTDLGLDAQRVCLNSTPLEDFGGGHPDPNLTYAHRLVHAMGLSAQGTPLQGATGVPDFGAAADGDADRNMILGRQFFVTPSDSVAIIVANARASIPYFRRHPLLGVARSMPTSGALDLVAKAHGLEFFEVPTGWKFFGNLMDAGRIQICGEESFGTGSDHVREKDGIWAVLAWLSILQTRNASSSILVGVQDIVLDHWQTYGRNYYTRYDFEDLPIDKANGLIEYLRDLAVGGAASKLDWGSYTLRVADEFAYTDPVDGSVSLHQGIRLLFTDGSRIIFRLSGTGSSSATIRLYIEAYEKDKFTLTTADALSELVALALRHADLVQRIGTETPTVIT